MPFKNISGDSLEFKIDSGAIQFLEFTPEYDLSA